MKYPVINNDYYYAVKKQAKEQYLKIGNIWCPALNDSINFTVIGFKHLIRSGRKPRAPRDQIRRFVLLPMAECIVTDGDVEIEYRKSEIISQNVVQFWGITRKNDPKEITVVIRQIGVGEKHFFSIFDQKTAR